MADSLTPEQRRRCMAAVRAENTAPEKTVRSLARRMGYRVRLHDADLPGKPDIVFPALDKVVFVHGCFWHQHGNCRFAAMPKTRRAFWREKLAGNQRRDRRVQRRLRRWGWGVMVIWECQLRDTDRLGRRLARFLG